MKRIAILLLCAVLLLILFINSWKSVRGTICDFDEKTGSMTVVAEDGQKYIVNDYLKHIPTGEEWNIGDVVKSFIGGAFRRPRPPLSKKKALLLWSTGHKTINERDPSLANRKPYTGQKGQG